MNEEIRLVTRQETFNDLAVRELAKNRAACICRIQFKRCSKSQCSSCPIHQKYMNCVDAMNDYDKLRLDSYTAEQYRLISANPDQWMSHSRFVGFYVKFFFAVIIGFLLLGLFFGVMFAMYNGPMDRPSDKYIGINKSISGIISMVQKDVYDLNKDGKVNCIDHAVLFKVYWDKYYVPDNCIIVRNRNYGTGMNHLFNRVYYKDKIIDVEPWAWNPYDYRMESLWGNIYDPKYNKYGETQKWLKEMKSE